MKKPDKSSRPRMLSDEDHELWEHAARTIKPIPRKSRVHASAGGDAATPSPAAGKSGKSKTAEHPGRGAIDAKAAVRLRSEAARPAKPPPLADFDQRHARKIRSGRVEIERRIDLHGMRQSEAHAVLRRFLHACHADGVRRVLVITGKGAPRKRRDDDEFGWGTSEPGVLRRYVPQWLAEPDLRAIVVSFTSAAVQHGGDGALYVHLRRQRD